MREDRKVTVSCRVVANISVPVEHICQTQGLGARSGWQNRFMWPAEANNVLTSSLFQIVFSFNTEAKDIASICYQTSMKIK